MNCVISSSPTTGLRTVHLLRSILFRALPSHAMPADSTLCLHLHFNVKFWPQWSFKPSTTNAVMPSQHVPPSQRKFPLDFKWLDGPSLALTQFNLPVVMSVMKHSRFRKSVKCVSTINPLTTHSPENTWLLFLLFYYSLHFFSTVPLFSSPFHFEWLWIT